LVQGSLAQKKISTHSISPFFVVYASQDGLDVKNGIYGRTLPAAIALLFVIAATFSPTFVGALDPEDIVWSSDTRLTWNEALDVSPSIMQALDGSIWVVWSSDREHVYNDLYCAISSDYGENWRNYSLTSTLTSWDTNPSIIQTRNGSILVVWGRTKMATPVTYDIYYRYSVDYGEKWSSAKNITDPSTWDEDPSIMEDAYGRIWVAWCRKAGGNREIFYKYSSDHGESWSPDTQLTNHIGVDKAPSIMQAADGSIWIAWASYRTGETVDYEILYKYTYDYGENWSSDTMLTNQTGFDVSPCIIQARDGSIFVFWVSDRIHPNDSANDLFYEISEDMAQTWSKPLGQRGTQLTTDAEQDVSPSAANIDDGRIWVTWSSNRVTAQADEFEVFYKISSVIPGHDVTITDVTTSSTKVYRGNLIDIYVAIKNKGTFSENFSVTAYYNSTSIETKTVTDLAPNANMTLIFHWNTSIIPYDYYTMSANASIVPDEIVLANNSFTDGAILVAIPGDVNGDGTVDGSDLFDLSKAYGCMPGDDNWDPECDINSDDTVDDFDLNAVSENYGKTV